MDNLDAQPGLIREPKVEKAVVRTGVGLRVADIHSPETVDILNELDEMVTLPEELEDPQVVFLTPSTSEHPIFHTGEGYFRGVEHNRSFSQILQDEDGALLSLTVKGGDLLNYDGLKWNMVRAGEGQIPGSADVVGCLREFNSAINLQKLALATLGRLTHTAVPLDVRRIDQVPGKEGVLISVKDFLNSSGYPQLDDRSRRFFGIPEGISLGELMLDQNGIVPAEYLYLIRGLNVRTNELASIPYFDEANNYLINDPLAWIGYGSGLTKWGGLVGDGRSKDEAIRAVYQALGREYGFNSDVVLPSTPITDSNYISMLSKIPRSCEEQGIAKLVLDEYIDKVTEVAALGHSADMTFSEGFNTGGSLINRNITFGGVVLDLDTLGPIHDERMKYMGKDFDELVLSVGTLSRLVSDKSQEFLGEQVETAYKSKIEIFCKDDPLRGDILTHISVDGLSDETKRVLAY